MTQQTDTEYLSAFDELDRMFADSDRHDEIVRLGWIEERNKRLIDKYGSLQDAQYQIDRDNHDPEDVETE